MTSTFTPNLNLEEPARNDDVGTWDTPVNNNMTLLDLAGGGVSTISLNNSPVVLSAAQFKSAVLVFNSTLTGNCAITFPTSFIKPYTIRNACTGSSAFVITLLTTASATQTIAAPPGESISVYGDGTSLNYMSLGRVGSYWDHGGSSVPAWVSACTVPPYLACVGGSFSGTTYPALAGYLGGTTLPDSRGRARYALDAGVSRVTSAISNVAGNTLFAGGGDQLLQQHSHANTLTDPSHVHGGIPLPSGAGGGGGLPTVNGTQNTAAAFTGMSINNANAGSGAAQNMPPVYVGGITMIRAG
jgi:hypothetical protein